MPSVLVTGGARSGKSAIAVELARRESVPVTFVATALAGDDDMAARIERHRAERPPDWVTIEEPLDPAGRLEHVARSRVVVLDCLTLWVSNRMHDGSTTTRLEADAEDLAARLLDFEVAIVITNEVGSGIVPDNELARSYRDTLGRVNAVFGRRFERVLLAVAGRTIEASAP